MCILAAVEGDGRRGYAFTWMESKSAGAPHHTALLLLALLTLGAGFAEPWVQALQPRNLVPWVGLSALAVAATFCRPREVDLFEPFTFLSWTHYAPAYVVGAFLLAIGVVDYPYPGLIPDPVGVCALALVYLVLGYLALGLGCRSRAAATLGGRLASFLPAPPQDRTIPLPAILLLVAIGLAAGYGAFRSGIIGYAVPRAPGPFDAAASYAVTFMTLGHFLFWFRWFDPRQKRLPRVTLAVPIFIVGSSIVMWGNRGMLLACFLVAAFAFRQARGRLSLAQGSAVVALAFVALSIGMVYGSLFRRLKGGETGARAASAAPAVTPPVMVPEVEARLTPSLRGDLTATSESAESPAPAVSSAAVDPSATAHLSPSPGLRPERPSMERQFNVATATIATLVQKPRSAGFGAILASAGQRLNLLSDVSVTIARYRALRPLEASHGIVDIWTQTWTGFVPRAIWPTKPRVGDPRAYGALYFSNDGNSFAISPPADLIRNGGPLVMPVGMALLGLVLGILHAALTTDGPAAAGGRAALCAMIVLSLNLEGPYGLLLPTMLRVGFVSLVGLGLLCLWRLPALRRRSSTE